MIFTVSLLAAGIVGATLVHELGHLAAALALRCDPRFLCIGIGMGRAVLRRRIGRVWIILRACPVGSHVLSAPLPRERWLAPVAAAGPAANIAALAGLVAAREVLPGPVWFITALAQIWLLLGALLPSTSWIGGRRVGSDGAYLLMLLLGRRLPSIDAAYAAVVSRMRLDGPVPAMTPAFAEIVVQQGRFDRREPWARRQAIDSLERVAAGADGANEIERALATAAVHDHVDEEQASFRRNRRKAGPAAAGGPCLVETARGNLLNRLWLAVLVLAVAGTIYDDWRRSNGEEGRLNGSHLRFELRADSANRRKLLALRGTIGGDAIVELREAIGRYGLRPGDILLLDSPGGRLGNAAARGRIIRGHGLATAVGALRRGRIEPADCASACVALFAAGTTRTLPEGSRLGIHRFKNLGSEGMSAARIQRSEDATERRQVAYFAEMGIAPALEEKAATVPPDDIRWLSPEDAVALRLATGRGDAG